MKDGARVEGPRCHCGAGLSIDYDGKRQVWVCHCPTCRARAQRDGAAVHVIGQGKTLLAAVEDWKQAKDTF